MVVRVIAATATLPIPTEVAVTPPSCKFPAEPTSTPSVALGLTSPLTNVAIPPAVTLQLLSTIETVVALAEPIVIVFATAPIPI